MLIFSRVYQVILLSCLGVAVTFVALLIYPESAHAAWEYLMLLGKYIMYIMRNYSASPSMEVLL